MIENNIEFIIENNMKGDEFLSLRKEIIYQVLHNSIDKIIDEEKCFNKKLGFELIENRYNRWQDQVVECITLKPININTTITNLVIPTRIKKYSLKERFIILFKGKL